MTQLSGDSPKPPVLDATLDFFGLMVRLYVEYSFTEDLKQDLKEAAILDRQPAPEKVSQYLQDVYAEHLQPFVAFCRKRLTEVPPIGMYPAGMGMGLRFADSTIVPFIAQDAAADAGAYDSMPITRSQQAPGGDMSDTRSFSIGRGKMDYGQG